MRTLRFIPRVNMCCQTYSEEGTCRRRSRDCLLNSVYLLVNMDALFLTTIPEAYCSSRSPSTPHKYESIKKPGPLLLWGDRSRNRGSLCFATFNTMQSGALYPTPPRSLSQAPVTSWYTAFKQCDSSPILFFATRFETATPSLPRLQAATGFIAATPCSPWYSAKWCTTKNPALLSTPCACC